MAVSIDWATNVIFVPRADMQLVQATPTEIRQLDIDAFRLELKDIEDGEGMPYPDTHRHNTTITVGGVTLARVVEILEPYTITFEDGAYQVNLVGANSNIADRTNLNSVGIRSANSAGLTFSEQINSQSFIDAAVTLNVAGGSSGTAFPRGTPTDPVNNLPDAIAIATARNLKKIILTGFVVATASEPLTEIEVVGGSGASNGVILSGADTTDASFSKLIVTGQQGGLARFKDCILGTTGLGGLIDVEGRIVDCIINNSAGITQKTAGAGCLFDNCAFVAPNDPQIVFDANGKGFGFRNCTGNILITNQTISEILQLHFTGARVEVAASATAGTLVFDGYGQVVDNSAVGCTVSTDEWISGKLLRLSDLAEADEEFTQNKAYLYRKGTAEILLEKDVTGGASITGVTLTDV